MAKSPTNAFTIDVEDYFQVEALSRVIPRDSWPQMEYRCENNVHRLLALLDDKKVRGTFFILGWIAERSPQLIREIAAAGHEIACHGMSHKLIYKQSREEFRQETRRSKQLLEDLVGKAVLGYRAASFSIVKSSPTFASCGHHCAVASTNRPRPLLRNTCSRRFEDCSFRISPSLIVRMSRKPSPSRSISSYS